MNKALLFMLGASVAMNVYLVNVEVVVKDELDQEYVEEPERDRITLAQAAVDKTKADSDKSAKECEPKIVEKIVFREAPAREVSEADPESEALKKITEQDLDSMSRDEMSELAATYQARWKQKSKNFFEYRLGLTPSQQGDYEKLKVAMESEISEMLRQSSPDNWEEGHSRMLGPEEMVEMGRIHQKYADKLKTTFGPAAYEEYIAFREKYNQALAKENKGIFGIQF